MVTNMLIKKIYIYIFNHLKFSFHFFVLFCFVLLESSGGYAETPNAFIFSLNNFERLAPFVSKVKNGNTKEAIDRRSDNGPTFGQDLLIFFNPASASQSFTYFGNYYPVPASVTAKLAILGLQGRTFSSDEVEVFYLAPSR